MNLFSHFERCSFSFSSAATFSNHTLRWAHTCLLPAWPHPHTSPTTHRAPQVPCASIFVGPFKTVSFRKSASEGRSFKAEVYFNFACLFYVSNTCGISNGHILGFTSLSSWLCWLWIRSWNVEKTFPEPSGLLHHRFFDLRSRRDDWESISAESR